MRRSGSSTDDVRDIWETDEERSIIGSAKRRDIGRFKYQRRVLIFAEIYAD